MRLVPIALMLAPVALTACSPAEKPASAPPPAQARAEPPLPIAPATETSDPALQAALAEFLGEEADSTRWVTRIVGQGDQRLALIYLVGMNWCGSGGCNLLILRHTPTGWEQVGNISRVSNPVRMLETSTNGLPDIGVTVSGGGGPPAYEAKASFDGRSYPRFPSDEPLVGADGWTAITDADIPPPAQ